MKNSKVSKKKIWTIIRTLLFIVIGLMNTVLIRPDDVGSWKNYLGYLFLIIAAIDLFYLIINQLKSSQKSRE